MNLGPLMLDLEGQILLPEEAELLQHPLVGGVILFQRNFQSPAQLMALVAAMRAVRAPLLIAVDHEGGRVQRFRQGFTRLPPVAVLGQRYTDDPQVACHLAQQLGWLMAAELRAVDIDFSFAPVLDLNRGLCDVIGDRAFHSQAEAVTTLAGAYMQGMKEAGMAATGKHFPGHGGVREDSHLALPIDSRSFEALEAEDMQPFQRLAQADMAAVMPAHVVYANIDPQAAGFSPFWLQKVLRRHLGFQGVIFSDDLNMAAAGIGGDFPSRARKALQAGCDMVLVCNNRAGAKAVLAGLDHALDDDSQQRLMRMLGKAQIAWADLPSHLRWLAARKDLAELL